MCSPSGPFRGDAAAQCRFALAAARDNPRDYEFVLATLKVVAKPGRRDRERTAVMINSLLAASTSTHDAYVNLVRRP